MKAEPQLRQGNRQKNAKRLVCAWAPALKTLKTAEMTRIFDFQVKTAVYRGKIAKIREILVLPSKLALQKGRRHHK